jgi:hypothetical protein
MSSKRKELYCGDTVNTLRQKDHKFQWSHAYKWYSNLPSEENNLKKVWTSGIALARCMLEVDDFKELVLWCTDKFDIGRRIV